MKKEADIHLDKQQIYNRDYFETNLKTASQPIIMKTILKTITYDRT